MMLMTAMLSLLALAVIPAQQPALAWQGMPIYKLHVSGNQLVNSNGEIILLSGWHQPTGEYWTYQNSNYYLSRNNYNSYAARLEYLRTLRTPLPTRRRNTATTTAGT